MKVSLVIHFWLLLNETYLFNNVFVILIPTCKLTFYYKFKKIAVSLHGTVGMQNVDFTSSFIHLKFTLKNLSFGVQETIHVSKH